MLDDCLLLATMAGKATIFVDPNDVMFTHSRIRPFFTGCGNRIEDTLQDIIDGRLAVQDLPLITIIENDGYYFSLNNRRLYVLKKLRSLGLLENNRVEVNIKPALEREKRKYTPENCSSVARIMNEHNTENTKATAIDELNPPSFNGFTEGSDDNNTSASRSNTIPVKKQTTPLTLRNCKISDTILVQMKDLRKLQSKGKIKAVLSQLDEWTMNGDLSDSQREFVERQLLGLS